MSSFDIIVGMIEKAKSQPAVMEQVKGPSKTFQISPSDSDHYYVVVGEGNISVSKGDGTSPAATISATDSLLSDIFSGKADAISAFMSGKLKVSGDIFGAQKLTDIMKKAGK
ncbi:MAG: SCP2 sterol-binding domain-containing protein [Candidatus Thermoplasmatota archaeon]|jgi:putative sterol carrier protein|nr:SCP2 sterol-binding domain-containing protein [Candidatus Thermoplasmatota archaeon]